MESTFTSEGGVSRMGLGWSDKDLIRPRSWEAKEGSA
jgi:hypothetical protein